MAYNKKTIPVQTFKQMGESAGARLDDNIAELELARDAAVGTITGQVADMELTINKMRQDAKEAAALRDFYAARESKLLNAANNMAETVAALKNIVGGTNG